MSKKRYVVRLSKSEREGLSALIKQGERKRRNEATTGVDWQFTTADARTRLRQLYPRFKA